MASLHFHYRQLILPAPAVFGRALRRNGKLRYLFEDCTFDTERRELQRGTDVVSITPQVFDLLVYLIQNRERVVSKDDLIGVIWNGRVVSDAAVTTRINAARHAIGDSGQKQVLIKTLPRKGFRFVGKVREIAGAATVGERSDAVPEHGNGHAPDPAAHNGASTTNRPSPPPLSIIVLPFANLSADPEQDYFVDGVTESLTTDLSRIRGSFVIGRHTAFTFKGKAVDIKQIGRELNVRYVFGGSTQRANGRLRVNAQLIDAETGNYLWAERFDRPVTDLFEMQDEIVSRLAATLNAQMIEAEARRAARAQHPSVTDLLFQGRACMYKGLTREHLAQARGFFEQALAFDPDNVSGLLGTASIDFNIAANFFTDDRTVPFAAAERTLLKAQSIDPDHAMVLAVLGYTHIYTRRVEQGIAECEQTLALDASLTTAHAGIGVAKGFLGRGEETEDHIRTALRLSPRDFYAHRWMMFAGTAMFWRGDDTRAVAWLRQSIGTNRNFPLAHFHLAAALAQLGALDEARAAAQAGLVLDPTFTIRNYRANALSDHPKHLAGRERSYQGLRMAAVPEG
ncbi:Transcriptional activator CadC [Bradyrhizobium ivorense]|uniref:Transcriptional activator CadC n=1 Tax=Bradyrhizobium ivorense TaxID=2511166 RepID=A0A508SUQ8_9BRAD|nr:Transcriptional activator CadC [Bradyrhizobium ivorense]